MNRDQVHEIIEQLKNGDLSVLETIYIENRKPFLRFSSRYNLTKEELLDIYQDSILAFVDNVKNGKIESLESTLRTYLFSIGKYMIFKKMKVNERLEVLPPDLERLSLYVQEIEDGRDKEEIALFNDCLKQLGKQCQELLRMFYYRGFDLEEIQEILGYDNYNVVKSQKSRCLKHLKTILNSKKNGY